MAGLVDNTGTPVSYLVASNFRMVVDNLVDAEIVLANGEVVHANEHENTDLYWGIRGI